MLQIEPGYFFLHLTAKTAKSYVFRDTQRTVNAREHACANAGRHAETSQADGAYSSVWECGDRLENCE